MGKTIEKLEEALKEEGLSNLGSFEINPKDTILQGFETLLLIGPDEPHFWEIFKNSYEYKHIKKNPLDEWSKHKIGELAKRFGAKPFFPFQENPRLPFYSWALRTRRIWESPVRLLVHDIRGLMVSFRGALAFKQDFKNDALESLNSSRPCDKCTAPCVSACPAQALTQEKYDVEKCQKYVQKLHNDSCMQGCLVRRSCPVGNFLRPQEQSSFHMQSFVR